jgi:drug/metabolite transporter (DMT)-like permease
MPVVPPSPWRAYAALAAGVVCIAWSGLLVRWAGISGVAAGFYRMAFAALVLVPWCFARRRATPSSVRGLAILALASGVLFACDNALFNIAVQRTAVAEATLLANVSPVFVGFGAWIMSGRRPHRTFWGGVLLSIVGCAAILRGTALGGVGVGVGPGAEQVHGDLLATLAAVFFAAYLITTQLARVGADTLTFTTLAVLASAATLLLASLVLRVPLGGYAPRTWAALVALGLVSQVCGYLAITYALGRLPATVISVGLLAQAPVTALVAAALLGESLRMPQIVGGVLVLAGIYAVTRHPEALRVPRRGAAQDASVSAAAPRHFSPRSGDK